jgi:hypothetical protein
MIYTKQELFKLRTNFEYFCNTILKIKPKKEVASKNDTVGGLSPFIFNPAQQITWMVMQEQLMTGKGINIIVLKSRQMGLSTLFVAWDFWNMWRRDLTTCGLIAHKKGTSESLIETCNRFYQNMPLELRPKLRSNNSKGRLNRNEIYFSDQGSSLNTAVSAEDVFRGNSLDILIATEVSSYKDPALLFEGLLPAMNESKVKTIVYESSPKDGWFRTKYMDAKAGKAGGCRAVYLPWFILPELYSVEVKPTQGKKWAFKNLQGEFVAFSEEEKIEWKALNKQAKKMKFPDITPAQMYWRQLKIQEYNDDIEVFRQEYISSDTECFQRSTQSAFKSSIPMAIATVDLVDEECPNMQIGVLESMDYYGLTDTVNVRFIPEMRAGHIDQEMYPGLIMFKPPHPDYTYTIGADVADELEGMDDLDNQSAYSVGTVYCCNTLEQVAEWRGKLSPFDFGDELVKLGYFYNTALINVEINNMGHTTIARLSNNLNYPNQFQWPDFDSNNGAVNPKKNHWFTNSKTKQLMIGAFNQAVRSQLFVVRSELLLREMESYIAKNGTYQCSDLPSDRIIAASLAWQAAMQTELAYHRDIIIGARPATKAFPKSKSSIETVETDELKKNNSLHYLSEDEGTVMSIEDLWDCSSLL